MNGVSEASMSGDFRFFCITGSTLSTAGGEVRCISERWIRQVEMTCKKVGTTNEKGERSGVNGEGVSGAGSGAGSIRRIG